ncbi:MAG: aldo/keto reductase [Sporomusaceae bacterium]|nr:aldo/keto reductase [Sporomusaceae bacterium]
MENLQTKATPQGTAGYAQKHKELAYRSLGNTGLVVSEAGFGSYRLFLTEESHKTALKTALQSGINLIDTSANYTDGQSEELIGQVLTELTNSGELARDEVVIVSKGGYLQGSNLARYQEGQATGNTISPEVLVFNETLAHSIHPDFLRDQIAASLARLNLSVIDCYLLHNPEYFFLWAKEQGMEQDAARREFLRRIEAAFIYLEQEVAAGRIGCYGISSNDFPTPADAYEAVSLSDIWQIAEKIAPTHHFKVVEFPLNIYEPGAILEKNQPGGQSLLSFAAAQELAVLINRPLNAMKGDSICRLTELSGETFRHIELLVEQIRALMELEEVFRRKFITVLPDQDLANPALFKGLNSGEVLQKHWYTFDSYWHWQDVNHSYFIPVIQTSIDILLKSSALNQELTCWIDDYVAQLNPLFKNIAAYYRGREQQRVKLDKAALAAADPDWSEAASLSQLALRTIRSTLGVTSVLVGMRQSTYVEDVLEDLKKPVAVAPREVSWQKLQEATSKIDLDSLALLGE